MAERSPESGAASTADTGSSTDQPTMGDRPEADPTRIVADADVLAADLLLDGPAREALDVIRGHSWLTLVASDALLADAEAVIERVAEADDSLATDWRDRIEQERVPTDHAEGDHPGLASAYRGNAAHLLTFDPDLNSAQANLSVQSHAEVSIRSPAAFMTVFDAASLYAASGQGSLEEYPGPNREPRD